MYVKRTETHCDCSNSGIFEREMLQLDHVQRGALTANIVGKQKTDISPNRLLCSIKDAFSVLLRTLSFFQIPGDNGRTYKNASVAICVSRQSQLWFGKPRQLRHPAGLESGFRGMRHWN